MLSRLLCVVCVYRLFTSIICECVLHVSQLTAVHEFDLVPGEQLLHLSCIVRWILLLCYGTTLDNKQRGRPRPV
jgi:hypothetical protein